MASADFPCSKDAIVRSATFGSGQDDHNVAGAEAGATLYSLLDFVETSTDNSGNPVNMFSLTTVTSAKFYMTRAPSGVHDSPDNGAGIRVQRITGDWQEGNKGGQEAGGEFYYSANAVNWSNKPAVSATIISGGSQPSTNETQWSVTITTLVQEWLDGSAKKGIQVRSSNDVLDVCFWSRHHATASKRPFLRLDWSTTAANTKPKAPTVVVL